VSFQTHDQAFTAILGTAPSITLIAQDQDGIPKFHEACIYHQPSKSVFITSNMMPLPSGEVDAATSNKTIGIVRVHDHEEPSQVQVEDFISPDLVMGNGGVNYKDGLLFCAQGNKDHSGKEGLVFIPDVSKPQECRSLVSTFHGRPFNSVNDVIVHPIDGSIWFTDPCYGHHQGIRPKPQLPNQVYRFEPETGSIRAIADGFMRCNGLCFSPDLQTLYVTDTGAIHGSAAVGIDLQGPSHIYAFDVTPSAHDASQPFLTNRRLFAYASGGWPDGIKCDMAGNVYSGCGDGIEVWAPSGKILGRILIEGGVANFCFGERGAIYACNETKLWKVQLGSHVRGALLGL
jgi:gluconolactonase